MTERIPASGSSSLDVSYRLQRAERRVRGLSIGVLFLAVVGALGAVSTHDMNAIDVITARGLVIVDEAGRERVVLGAPGAAASANPRLADAIGLVVLDTVGRLATAIGIDPPLMLDDGTVGKRIGSSAGMTLYDPRDGKERGGISAFEDGRANVCLDYGQAQKEAACITVAPGDQYAAVLLNGTPREEAYDRVGMFLGADGVGVLKAFGGVSSRDGVFIRAGGGLPTITVYDSTHSKVMDIVEQAGR